MICPACGNNVRQEMRKNSVTLEKGDALTVLRFAQAHGHIGLSIEYLALGIARKKTAFTPLIRSKRLPK